MKLQNFSGLFRYLLLWLIFVTMFLPITLLAEENEQYYISPRLQLGLHTQASMESPIKKLIASGMAVEVLKTDKEFSQIKTQDGVEGWIKTQFLTQDEPALQKVEKLEQQLQDALSQHKSIPDATISATEKAQYEETITTLQEELKAWQQLDSQDKQAHRVQLEKNTQQLQQRLAMIASLATGEDVQSKPLESSTVIELPGILTSTETNILKLLKKNYLILLMVAGVSFLLGLFVMDVFNRRRHGGYRI